MFPLYPHPQNVPHGALGIHDPKHEQPPKLGKNGGKNGGTKYGGKNGKNGKNGGKNGGTK